MKKTFAFALFDTAETLTVYTAYTKDQPDPLPTFAEYIYNEVKAIGMTDGELKNTRSSSKR